MQPSTPRTIPGTPLADVVGLDREATLRRDLGAAPFRRLSNADEVRVAPSSLCQQLHVERLEGPAFRLLGDDAADYRMHSVESAIPEIDKIRALGMRRLYLHIVSDLPEREYGRKLERLTAILAKVRSYVGTDMELIVDPQGLCMRDDLRWGVTNASGEIDATATLELLALAARQFADAGMDVLVTIGRINHEAEVAKKALAKSSRAVRLMSFSTNSETPNAYFDATRYDVGRSRTGQKILVANAAEMVMRAVMDVAEGTDVVVQKPLEGLHILTWLCALRERAITLENLLRLLPAGERLWRSRENQQAIVKRGSEELVSSGRRLEFGAYEISGTYSILRDTALKYSENLAWAMLDELFRNALAAGGRHMTTLIARSATWYLERRQQLALA